MEWYICRYTALQKDDERLVCVRAKAVVDAYTRALRTHGVCKGAFIKSIAAVTEEQRQTIDALIEFDERIKRQVSTLQYYHIPGNSIAIFK